MKVTKYRYKRLEKSMPISMKPVKISNYKFMYAMFYVMENSCKWRVLPKKYGKWHVVYIKFSGWQKTVQLSKLLLFSLKP